MVSLFFFFICKMWAFAEIAGKAPFLTFSACAVPSWTNAHLQDVKQKERAIQCVLSSAGAGVDVLHMYNIPTELHQASAGMGHFACTISVCFSSEYMPSTLQNFRYFVAELQHSWSPTWLQVSLSTGCLRKEAAVVVPLCEQRCNL